MIMKVILKENVDALGKAGDAVKVSDGYARNYLIPKKLAIEANVKNLKVLEHEKKNILQRAEKDRKVSEALAQKFSGVTCTIARRIGEQDKLFGSITTKDIQESLLEQKLDVDRKGIIIDEPIKALGEFPVKIKLHSGVTVEIKVIVVAEP
jgi:large subunit ribosomal protein L9